MLVISRKAGESLVISENIRITIVSLGNDKVTVGIDAPKEIKVVREELMETIEVNKASNVTAGEADYRGIANLIKNSRQNGNK
ncbi:MAG TPA: carbon storage regulator [Anaerovoracaceae bacterium]|nr:carbon storage regulator [Anaerovoracaceae bacterium]